ncbi:OB-fold nucleic acid binding domain-containing protein [Georgenia sp. 10Sc9-8]|uniref:OB-fold nucleic acid binding domain-containing protein n=1 Tax=Georgenia halotolerans TaxID=3028317 RepID=A0ABT5U0I3_9MICO|nr:OB-fold nucleic acid binding domain-containing protein [Georgenia halotolerans]
MSPAAPPTSALRDVRVRTRARVGGTLVALTYRPSTQVPALVGRLSDGTGTVELVWLGRRTIAGVRPGSHLVAEGMVADGPAGPTIYNPDYELRTAAPA